jgi:hypothetical protein
MTELNIAYSYNGNDIMDENSMTEYQPDNYQNQQPQQPQHQPQQQPQQLQPQAPPPPVSQPPPVIYYQPPQQHRKPPPVQQRTPEYSFWDRMMLSSNDVFKLILLAFVVVLGISIEKFGSHYMNTYLSDNILSPIQEFIIRLSYPLLIFIFLWIIKSL